MCGLESDQKGLWLNCHFLIKSCYQIYLNQTLEMYTCAGLIIYKSNFILLNISYQNEHLECGQNGATTAIPTALRPLVSYLVVGDASRTLNFLRRTLRIAKHKSPCIQSTCSTKTRIRALCMGSAPRQVEKCVRGSTEPRRMICHTPMAQYQCSVSRL